MSDPARTWQVLLIGGASGTGKSSVSFRLARHFGIGITQVDDFQVIFQQITTPEQQPLLHYWRTHPEAMAWSEEKIVEHSIAVGRVMQPALEAVIANHLEGEPPIVLEGDFILPSLGVQTAFNGIANNGQVRAIFLIEDDEAQIRQNYLAREPQNGDQTKRARVSWLYNQWLKQEAERVGTVALAARPWETVFERTLAVL